LVVIIPIDNPGEVESLEDLGKPGLRLVLAVPGVPVRDYADQMIAALAEAEYGAGYADAVYASVVSEEDNVRQVAAKVALGEADAGVVYASDVTPNLKDQVQQIDVPDAFNVLATYPIAIIKDSDEAELANTFIAYVLGEQGQAVLTRWGFGAAPGE
jgi:molybdate transport system substrate-binding protein